MAGLVIDEMRGEKKRIGNFHFNHALFGLVAEKMGEMNGIKL